MSIAAPLHILLVEDDEVDVELIERTLKLLTLNHVLHVANNGMDALDMLCGTNGSDRLNPLPHLILLDIKMPLMNGIEFLKKMRGDPMLAPINVIIITTSNTDKDKYDSLNLNVVGYFQKPLRSEEFVNLCQNILL